MPKNVFGMSDEDFAQLQNPSDLQDVPPVDPVDPPNDPIDPPVEPIVSAPVDPAPVDPVVPIKPIEPAPVVDPLVPTDPTPPAPAVEEENPAPEVVTPDYQGFYNKVVAPLNANGKTIDIRSPEEAIQLMQMGANYTKKMQTIAPYRKVLTMLENNGLLDEGKLGFLIDLDKKNPEAIKKLLKDSGVDPLDIDTSVEPVYSEGNHRVSDEEVNFRAAVEDVSSTPTGNETLQMIRTQWDQASKDVLWANPELMHTINEQRANGIYAQVAAEIDRQRMLGVIPANLPFIQAYQVVGDDMVKRNAVRLPQPTPPVVAPPVAPVAPIATKPVATQRLDNATRASAAAPVRATPSAAKQFINPLALSDEDFLQQMQNRL